MRRTVATGIRKLRKHGTPSILFGFTVIRSEFVTRVIGSGGEWQPDPARSHPWCSRGRLLCAGETLSVSQCDSSPSICPTWAGVIAPDRYAWAAVASSTARDTSPVCAASTRPFRPDPTWRRLLLKAATERRIRLRRSKSRSSTAWVVHRRRRSAGRLILYGGRSITREVVDWWTAAQFAAMSLAVLWRFRWEAAECVRS